MFSQHNSFFFFFVKVFDSQNEVKTLTRMMVLSKRQNVMIIKAGEETCVL
jgi:hypothetical protein